MDKTNRTPTRIAAHYPFTDPLDRRLFDVCATIGSALDLSAPAHERLRLAIEHNGVPVDDLKVADLVAIIHQTEETFA